MSLVDDVFGGLPAPLIDQWGVDAVYVKTSEHRNYDPETGTMLGIATEIPIRTLISALTPKEHEGFYQVGGIKFLIPASYLGDYYPSTVDSIRYMDGLVARTADIVMIKPIRGDRPIMHTVFGRIG